MAALGVDVNVGNDDGESNTAIKVPERVLRRDQARLEEAERRRNVKESQTVTEEKSDFFKSTFNDEKTAVEEMLSICNHNGCDKSANSLEEITLKIQQLQKFLNDSMRFLTQYEIRQAQASLQKLQSSLAEKRDELLPKKKFAFRSRNTGANKQPAPVQQTTDTSESDVGGTVSVNQCGFSNADSQVLSKQAEEIQQRDVLLSHLTNCKVRLYGCPSTVHIKNVRGCEILCGPVSSSVFVDQCTDSTLVFPCQQLRTHNTTATLIYIHVTSRAIIEDCHGVRFAPFTWTYPGIHDHFKVAGLDPNRNNWREVDDFNWLAAGTPSPNWSVIPETERICSWDVVGHP
ncbi:tubulin-specific chaperone C-like [Sinocyclocheilus rhinocerous]|uniref:Tubulin-specific chaperone C n=1 Tax=Sinocyclocheilus rhinocerous TaxID=307959 RepID=A0A673KCL5_9TELE|nr:PREDICTED: tubulin-specific chaperone C-like [Sinocyclocheilus rhinocerous]